MLRDSIDGTGYLDNWDSDSPIDPMVPGRMVNPLVLNLSIFTDQIALDYTPLCNGCHDLSHVGTGGHSGNISCVNCHQHGGSFNGN
jgi:hypothetical protein